MAITIRPSYYVFVFEIKTEMNPSSYRFHNISFHNPFLLFSFQQGVARYIFIEACKCTAIEYFHGFIGKLANTKRYGKGIILLNSNAIIVHSNIVT